MDLGQKKTKGLSVETREEGKVAIVRFLDRTLNFHLAESLRDELKRTIRDRVAAGSGAVVLDLSEVGVVDSCGVGLVIAASNLAASLGATLGIFGASPFVERVFDVMRLRRHLQLFPTEAEALAAVAPHASL